ncbi:MAG TPA: GatB/YqeY domain-containing protein [Candidatus Paceibacterota bacterium]
MSYEEKIKADLIEAMKAKETLRVNTLRGLIAGFTNELVAKGKKPNETTPDDIALPVLKRLANQRKDSIEQFTKGGRTDLADIEKKELEIIFSYLPAQMSQDEIRKVAEAKKAELGIADKSKAGVLTGAVMKELKGRADGGEVKIIVDSLFD